MKIFLIAMFSTFGILHFIVFGKQLNDDEMTRESCAVTFIKAIVNLTLAALCAIWL